MNFLKRRKDAEKKKKRSSGTGRLFEELTKLPCNKTKGCKKPRGHRGKC